MRGFTGSILFVFFLVVLFLRQGVGLYVDWRWFQEVGYGQIFTTSLCYKFIVGLLAGGGLAVLVYWNLKIAATAPAGFRISPSDSVIDLPAPDILDPFIQRLILPAALLLGLAVSPQAAANWELLPFFLNSTPFKLQDPQVFYNKEDLLSTPRRSDSPHYGKLTALEFPKAKLVYGPKQIDARIDQDTHISQQLSLWNQRGSQVIRGSLLAIPIEKSLLYVQPLYLAAEQGSLPELKRVIVAFGNQIAMEETLEQSLQRIFGGKSLRESAPTESSAVAEAGEGERGLARQALDHFQRSQEMLRQGNWSGYGEELKKVETLLRQMQKNR